MRKVNAKYHPKHSPLTDTNDAEFPLEIFRIRSHSHLLPPNI